jgi:hypothetical protein
MQYKTNSGSENVGTFFVRGEGYMLVHSKSSRLTVVRITNHIKP